MSSKIIMKQEVAANIEAVSAWYADIFVDVADGKVKVKWPSSTEVLASESYGRLWWTEIDWVQWDTNLTITWSNNTVITK